MKKDVRDLTEGPLLPEILLFSVPLIFSYLLQILFNLSDIAVVGRFAGAIPLGSVGSTSIVLVLFTGFLIGLGGGVNAVTARCFGQRHPEEIRESVHAAFFVCLGAGLLILLLGQLIAVPLLRLLHTREELFPGAVRYLRICLLGMPSLAVYNFGNAVFSAAGDTRKPLVFLTVSGILNVLLNLFFVIVCRLEASGVAIATVLSETFSAVCIVRALLSAEGPHRLSLPGGLPSRQKARLILSVGVPAGVQNAIFSLANLFVQYGVNSFSAVTVAGNAAASNADAIVYNTMTAFYTACGSFVGQNYGARNMVRVRTSYHICTGCAFTAGAVLGLSLRFFGPQFLSIFTDSPEVVAAGMERLNVMGIAYMLSAFMDGTIAASRGLARGLVPTVLVILGSCVFRITWIFTVFRIFHTMTMLYMLYICSFSLTAVLEIIYFRWLYRRIVSGKTR